MITGTVANGKSTFGKLTARCLVGENSPKGRVVHIDTSEMITWACGLSNAFGKKFKEAVIHYSEAAKNLPDELIEELAHDWFDVHLTAETVLVVWSGAPRTRRQNLLKALFCCAKVVFIDISEAQSETNFFRRAKMEAAEKRIDGNQTRAHFDKRWETYLHDTVPAIQELNGAVLQLEYRRPLAERLHMVLDHMRPMTETGIVSKRMINNGHWRLRHNLELISKIKQIEAA